MPGAEVGLNCFICSGAWQTITTNGDDGIVLGLLDRRHMCDGRHLRFTVLAVCLLSDLPSRTYFTPSNVACSSTFGFQAQGSSHHSEIHDIVSSDECFAAKQFRLWASKWQIMAFF